jgi:taurine dioxygenase
MQMNKGVPGRVKPLCGALGAEVFDVDLADLNEGTLGFVKQAFRDYLVLAFRDQSLTPEQLLQFATHIGPPVQTNYIKPLPGHPFVYGFVREADERKEVKNLGGDWHCDGSYTPEPPIAVALYGVDIPPYGGDTIFTNLHLAYEHLSEGMRGIVDRLVTINAASVLNPEGRDAGRGFVAQKGIKVEVTHDPDAEVEHPLVRIHPDTGRRTLWLPGFFGRRLKGMNDAESRLLLDYLEDHAHRPEFTCRVVWAKGTLTLWDNRAVQHVALNDYPGFRRAMHRVQIGASRPVGVFESPQAAA